MPFYSIYVVDVEITHFKCEYIVSKQDRKQHQSIIQNKTMHGRQVLRVSLRSPYSKLWVDLGHMHLQKNGDFINWCGT